jgi:alcohol dehydrogenase, propanol-preferring
MPRAARYYKPREGLKLEQIPKPAIRENEVLLHVRAAGICHTDVTLANGLGFAKSPMTPGHEFAGEVDEIGTGAKGRFERGDRVLVYPIGSCGACPNCLKGMETRCLRRPLDSSYGMNTDGGFAEFCKVDANRLIPLPKEIDWDFGATLGCAGLTAYHAVKCIANVREGENVGLYGIGGIGLYALQIAKLAGARTIGIGRSEAKLKMAQALGADSVVSAAGRSGPDIVTDIRNASGGYGVDVMLDFVVNEDSVGNSLGSAIPPRPGAVANGGRVVTVGAATNPAVSYSPNTILLKELSILGTVGGTKKDLQELVELARTKKIKSVVTNRVTLDEVNDGLLMLERGAITGKCCMIL